MRRVLCFLLCSIGVILFLGGGRFSEAGDRLDLKLRGTFQVNFMRTCGDYELLPESPPLFRRTMFFHARGEATYNGDGTGSFDAEWIVVDPLNERVSTWSGNCMINYVVHDRRNFTQELTCDGSLNTSTTEPPPPPVLTLERTGIIIEGVIARDGKLLLLSDTAANWEYTTITVGPTGPIVNEFRSQCGRTGTAVRARRVIHRDEED